MKHKLLALEFKKRNLTYKQYCRRKDAAIYGVYSSDKRLLGYETIEIGKNDGYALGDAYIEPAETYPGDNSFGKTGWYFGPEDENETALTMAKKKYKEIEK